MRHIQNALLAGCSILVGLVMIELVVFPLYLRVIPTNLITYNERFGQLLAQSSKAGVIPRDYIMLTGDSYSVGLGSAYLLSAPGSREPYASAHFIAQRLGRDVVSVGNGGWGNVTSALAPALFAEQARLSLRYPVPPPAALLYYFYEGNDLQDNANWARAVGGADFTARPYSSAEIESLIDAHERNDARLGPKLSRVAEANLPAAFFVGGLVRAMGENWLGGAARNGNPAENSSTRINRALVAGAEVDLPNRLQAPPLGLSEIDWGNGLLTAKIALKALSAAYPEVPIAVVYVPSPLASYDIVSDEVSYQNGPRRSDIAVAPAQRVAERLNRLRRDICDIARELGYGFIDATPAIRAAGRRVLVHGPRDWGHFNLDGYRVLGDAISDTLATGRHPARPQSCEPAPP